MMIREIHEKVRTHPFSSLKIETKTQSRQRNTKILERVKHHFWKEPSQIMFFAMEQQSKLSARQVLIS
jgi:hypothetical protein